MKKLIFSSILLFASATTFVNAQWSLTGNAGTSATTNFIGTTDNVAFKIRTKNVVRITVAGAGNVGIGTASPANKLSVSGNADFSGNVGIGTNSPTTPLQISSNSNGVTPQFLLYEADNDYARINFQNNSGGSYWAIGGYNNVTQANEKFTIYNSKAGADLFAITGTGKVGIGITTPTGKLDVTDHSLIRLANFDGGNDMYIALKENGIYRGYLGSFSGAAEDVDFGTGGTNSTGAVNFTIQGTPKMTIVNNGNVGIGTSTPGYKLDVCGAIRGKEVRVETGWCDYVFAHDYKLAPLSDVESYINTHKHLPDVTPGSEIESNGLEVGKVSAQMIKKIEELTLYVIAQEKAINSLKIQNEQLQLRMNSIDKKGGN